ncbi:MAG TPA: hypothetical protein VFV05_19115 [Methylomirabilota bacterium]|nr:hypothetical protein [Methylomirabilota bacterium]
MTAFVVRTRGKSAALRGRRPSGPQEPGDAVMGGPVAKNADLEGIAAW